MNKRVIKLAKKAGFIPWGKEDWNPGDVIDWSARYDDELEKFSHLLIRECLVFVALDRRKLLLKHFQIEETQED